MPISKAGQEIVITRYRDDDIWQVSVSDVTFVTKLKNAGYKPVSKDGGYTMFELPLKAVGIRKPRKKTKPTKKQLEHWKSLRGKR